MGDPGRAVLTSGKRPKMLICDIDGTLTDENYTLHPGIPVAFRKLEEIGIPVALATGNVRPVAWTLARHLGITGPIICENGGVVWDWTRDEEVYRLVHGERARNACEWLASQIDGLDPEGILSNAWRESEWCLYTQEDYDQIVNLISNSEWNDLEVVRTGFAIHINEPGLNKGKGIEFALGKIGIDPQDCIGVGDSPNDLPMFETVGWSVAVGSAFPEVKNAASAVADDSLVGGHAVVALIEEILELEE